jgi:carboxymethylenebutenolidase
MPTLLSGGTSIRIEQVEPTTAKPFPAILLLHGSGGNLAFWFDRFAPQLSRLGVACYAVHYFDRTGTTRADAATILDGRHVPLWLTTIADTLAYIAGRPGIDPSRIALLGVSLGAFLSLAAATASKNIRAIVEISGGLAQPYASQATSSFPPTLILHGEADSIVPVSHATELNALLDRLSVPHQMQLFPSEGHWFSAAAQLRILATTAQFLGRYL